ncbi:hypothetical protein SteCoe_3036 [Stentor coeruleus]|uniref:Major facilitator superfamily (MFS) profile domain-containing protein n=1 Tax=Stentor coeruleus TaxID=5963 RepID=A0A1R2CXX1_9CILI|nr:hypothetical protein SteCoe_3036 [Stentor coeruleus]
MVNWLSSKWGVLLKVTFIGILYQTQHYGKLYLAFGYIASGSSMLEDTNINNWEYSLLSGPAMLFISAISLLPSSRYSDYATKPKFILIFSCICAAVFTGCNIFATSFLTLLWPRVLFSTLSSPIAPMNLRIMAEFFDMKKRGFASGAYFLSLYIGLALASLCMLISVYVGWRFTYLFLGLVSLSGSFIFGILLPTIKNTKEKKTLSQDLKSLYMNKTLILCVIGLAFKYISQFTRSSFESLYFARAFPDDVSTYSILNSIGLLVCPWSPLILGKISDDLECKYPNIKVYLCAITLALPIPFFIIMYLTTNFALAMVCLYIMSLFSEAYISLSYTIMINVTLPHIKALQTAWMMAITMFSGGVIILIIGFTYNTIEDLRISLIISNTFPLLISSMLFFLITKVYLKDLKTFEENKAGLVNESFFNEVTTSH